MKFAIPEISWHNRDPVLSVDFQPKCQEGDPLRLATGGTDSHVLIWYTLTTEAGSVNLEVAADLTRHQKAVNVVRWSPNGQYLASGDDEAIIFIWKQKTDKEPTPVEGEEQYKETWVIHKTLRGHMEDVLDISWSSNSLHLASGSVDNKLLLWDINRGRYTAILADHKGFVQGVSWDPRGQLIATASTDRVFRTFDIATKKVISRSSKASLPFPAEHPLHNVSVRLFHDDTLQTYYRRLQFSPDGLLVAVPAGRVEPEQSKPGVKPINAVYIYTRYSLKVPACVLPCGEPALAVRWSPRQYALRPLGPKPAFPAERRMLLAVATKRSLIIYDTQQKTPVAIISNIHYTRLTDLTWSWDGRTLVAASTDGFCSVIMFADGELGEPLPEPPPAASAAEQSCAGAEPMEVQTEELTESTKEKTEEPKSTTQRIDSFIKFKPPTISTEKSPKKQKTKTIHQKTPVKMDVMFETAMPSWSDNSSNEIIRPSEVEQPNIEIMVIEDSEDIKLVYEDSQLPEKSQSPTKSNKSPKAKSDKNESPKADTNKNEYPKAETNKNKTPKAESNKTESPQEKSKRQSPRKTISPKQGNTPTSKENNFLKQAKVTDVREPGAVQAVRSPKAPRRVNFVTLSSPKNKKKS